mgnify:CR=1 FL=1
MSKYQKDREATKTPKRFKEHEKHKGETRRNNGHHIEREIKLIWFSHENQQNLRQPKNKDSKTRNNERKGA